jgi:hypothetical protein
VCHYQSLNILQNRSAFPIYCCLANSASFSSSKQRFLSACKNMITYEVTDIMNTQNQRICKSVVLFRRMFKVNITEELDTGKQ